MFKIIQNNKGFTLIELLVVVAIISLLSSIVFASLNSAREKGRLSAIKQEMIQLRNVLNLNYSNTNGFNYLNSHVNRTNPLWINTQSDCDYSYGTNYDGTSAVANDPVGAAQMLPICKKMISLVNPSDVVSNFMLIGNTVGGNGTSDKNKYSITVIATFSTSTYYCMGSSGTTFNALGGTGTDLGCFANP